MFFFMHVHAAIRRWVKHWCGDWTPEETMIWVAEEVGLLEEGEGAENEAGAWIGNLPESPGSLMYE